MGNKIVLVIGTIVSFLYITLVVWVDSFSEGKKDAKLLFNLKKGHIEIVSKLSTSDKNSPLHDTIESVCKEKTCDKKIDFLDEIKSPKWLKTVKELISFAKENNISKAYIIANKDLEVNFLLKSESEFKKLKKIYANIQVKDNSSVLKMFSIENIQDDINSNLKDKSFVFNSDEITLGIRKVLNTTFRKLKELGSSSVVLYLNIDEDKISHIEDFIRKNYSWIKQIQVIKSDKNQLKIKEVLT